MDNDAENKSNQPPSKSAKKQNDICQNERPLAALKALHRFSNFRV